MRNFAYVMPESLDQAQLAAKEKGAVLKAGGIDLLDLLKADLIRPDKLVNLHSRADLREISRKDDGLHIGALATLADLAAHAEAPAVLAHAAGAAATPQIRNVATVAATWPSGRAAGTSAATPSPAPARRGTPATRRRARTSTTRSSTTAIARWCTPPASRRRWWRWTRWW